MRGYPVTLDLSGRLAVVLGAAPPAEEKVRGLLAAGARVRAITPAPGGGLLDLALNGAIELYRRRYESGDLAAAWLAIAIPEDAACEGAAVVSLPDLAREATARRVFLNVVDRPAHCTFAAPAIVHRGDLTVAISTAGAAPALAARLRDRLARRLGPEYARFLALAGSVRERLAVRHPDLADRRARWYRLVDSDALRLLRRGRDDEARRRFEEILGVAPNGVPIDAPTPGEA